MFMASQSLSNSKQKPQFSEKDFCNLVKTILPDFPASIYVKDEEGHYVWCNNYQLHMAGFTKLSEMQGKTDHELPWKAQAEQITNVDKQVLRSAESVTAVERPVLHNGKEAVFLTKKVPWFANEGNSKPSGIMGVSIELTEYEKIIQNRS
jgi:PAS domain-containing protein